MACHVELNVAVGYRIWILHCDNVNRQVGSRSIRVCGSRAITWRTWRRSRIEIACSAPVNRRGPTFARERNCLHPMHSNEVADNELRVRYLQSFTRAKNEIAAVICGCARKYVYTWLEILRTKLFWEREWQKGWKMLNITRGATSPLFTLTFLLYYFSCVSFTHHR